MYVDGNPVLTGNKLRYVIDPTGKACAMAVESEIRFGVEENFDSFGSVLSDIDGKFTYRLNHNSVVELAGLRFVFLVNQKLINSGMANHIQ